MMKSIRNQNGMSLLETTLGILILAMGFLGMMPMMTTATANVLKSDNHVTATFLANQKMEEIIAAKEFQGYSTITTAAYPSTTTSVDGTTYLSTTAVTEVNPTDLSTPQASSGYKSVVVTVAWGQTDAQGGYIYGGQMTMTTLLTNY